VGKDPLVSVVTPFFNTARYLAECVESVLAQSLGDFEYLLVDNQSTDGSAEVAARYAARDPRIRVLRNERFLSQVENYNGALERASPGSRYLKVMQADDALFPDCLARLVEIAERDPRIGLVGSYYLKGPAPRGGGMDHRTWRLEGVEACRRMLLVPGFFPVGSPTSVLYRADLVRGRRPFYATGRYHEDTEAAFEILLGNDLGFVPQVLSFLRTDNESISSAARRFDPDPLDHLILLERYGPAVLSEEELDVQRRREWSAYLGGLRRSMLRSGSRDRWRYHAAGLETIGVRLRLRDLLPSRLKEVLRVHLPVNSIPDARPVRPMGAHP
jgi:glycosyltransferase involved in cell wall biosynthesis